MTKHLPWLLALVLVPLASFAEPREQKPERVLVVTDGAPAVLHVAAGQPTVLAFDVAPLAEGTRVEGRAAVAVMVTERSIVLFPERDLSERDEAALMARLSDGSRLRFQLVSVAEEVDERIRVRRSLEGASPGELRARLERCEQGRGGVEAMAAYLVEHSEQEPPLLSWRVQNEWHPSDGPVAFDRLMEDRASGVAFAIFDVQPKSPLLLRDPRLVGASGRELRLLRALPGSLAFGANGTSRIVLAFETSGEPPASARFYTPEGVALEVAIDVHPRSPPAR